MNYTFVGRIVAIGLMLVSAASATAAIYPEKPPNTAFYVDQANIIEPAEASRINETASQLLSEIRVPIFVVTIRSLAGQDAAGKSIEQYARGLFDHWGIGFSGRNNGVLLLVSTGDRKARIELGEEWAHKQNTAAQSIMDTLIIPNFKKEAFSVGIFDGVRGLDAMVRGADLPKPTAPWWFWPAVIVGTIAVVALVYSLFKSGRTGWAWVVIVAVFGLLFFILRSLPNNRLSSSGFGGGSGGGGGATGSW
ncbi:MAG: TPM domain-containing protein [Pseudomonadota bacterium]